jgi:hypothetical protein
MFWSSGSDDMPSIKQRTKKVQPRSQYRPLAGDLKKFADGYQELLRTGKGVWVPDWAPEACKASFRNANPRRAVLLGHLLSKFQDIKHGRFKVPLAAARGPKGEREWATTVSKLAQELHWDRVTTGRILEELRIAKLLWITDRKGQLFIRPREATILTALVKQDIITESERHHAMRELTQERKSFDEQYIPPTQDEITLAKYFSEIGKYEDGHACPFRPGWCDMAIRNQAMRTRIFLSDWAVEACAGRIVEALMLSQILYNALIPRADGAPRCKQDADGLPWFFHYDCQWQGEFAIGRRTAIRARQWLEKHELIYTKPYVEGQQIGTDYAIRLSKAA